MTRRPHPGRFLLGLLGLLVVVSLALLIASWHPVSPARRGSQEARKVRKAPQSIAGHSVALVLTSPGYELRVVPKRPQDGLFSYFADQSEEIRSRVSDDSPASQSTPPQK